MTQRKEKACMHFIQPSREIFNAKVFTSFHLQNQMCYFGLTYEKHFLIMFRSFNVMFPSHRWQMISADESIAIIKYYSYGWWPVKIFSINSPETAWFYWFFFCRKQFRIKILQLFIYLCITWKFIIIYNFSLLFFFVCFILCCMRIWISV